MYQKWGKTITSSDHLVSHIDNVLRQQDGFEGNLTYTLLQGTRWHWGALYNVFQVDRHNSEVHLCRFMIGTNAMPQRGDLVDRPYHLLSLYLYE